MSLGDLNCHFSRNSAFTSIVQDFFDEIDFRILWENPDETVGHLIHNIDFTFKQDSNEGVSSSIIDHFVGNSSVYNAATEAGVVHSGDNPSNHSPIYLKIRLGHLDFKTEKAPVEKFRKA